MIDNLNSITQLVKHHCEDILLNTKCATYPFHNIVHTQEVAKQAKWIGQNMSLSPDELEPIIIAAWFHDTGFFEKYKGHEDVSIRIAKDFLQKQNYQKEKIEIVISCIEGTKIPQNPQNKYAEILSDADIYHISQDAFFYRKLLLRREWELVFNKHSSDLEWHQLNLEFLQGHKFFTSYGKSVLMDGQKRNEERVKNLICLY